MVLITLIIGYFIFNKQKHKSYNPALVPSNLSFSLQVQLTAYERLTLFVERSYPPNLVAALYDNKLTKSELQAVFVQQISEEFNHNLSQQIYISTQTWDHLREYKDRNIMYINLLASSSSQDESSKVFVTNIISFFNEKEQRAHYLLLLDAL